MNLPYRLWAEINLDTLSDNIRLIRKATRQAAFFAVVKADAYGHGAVPIARAIESEVSGIAVASLEEALEIRRSGFSKAIAVLSFADPGAFAKAVKEDIILTVFSYAKAVLLNDAAKKAGKIVPFFLATDTGMTRIGVMANPQGEKETEAICSLSHLFPYCIYSHPACAENPDSPVTEKQRQVFRSFCLRLEKKRIVFPFSCFCNSAALPQRIGGNLCKIGLLMYGIPPESAPSFPVTPILSLHAKIIRIESVPAGTGIGYSHAFITPKPMRVATVSAGYADGVPYLLSGRGGYVLTAGKPAPILGKICMDQMMVDVTFIEEADIGQNVTLIGKDGERIIKAEDWSRLADTVVYDILCSVGRRVTRVYMKNGQIKETLSYLSVK